MRRTYSVLAWIIAAGVVIQAAAIAFGFGGMASYVQGGGVVDKALVESRTVGNFTGELGFPIHAEGESTVVPGLHFVGVHFLRKRKSSILYGIAEDAAVVAERIASRWTGRTSDR